MVIHAHVITSGQHHDFDFVRHRVLGELLALDHVRTTCSSTYAATGEIAAADLLVTYTNNVVPDAQQLPAVEAFLARGGRWLALHGTAAIVRFSNGPPQQVAGIELPGLVETPNDAPAFFRLVGGRFIAHLPYDEITVTPVGDDELTRGIGAFTVFDEPYCMELEPDGNTILLDSRFTGMADTYAVSDWREDRPRPLMWRRQAGGGEIVFLALGHRCGRFDLLDLVPEMPTIMTGPWENAQFSELFRRCIRWGAQVEPVAA